MPILYIHSKNYPEQLDTQTNASSKAQKTKQTPSSFKTNNESSEATSSYSTTPIHPILSPADIPVVNWVVEKEKHLLSSTSIELGFPNKTRSLKSNECETIIIQPKSNWIIIQTPLNLFEVDKNADKTLRMQIENLRGNRCMYEQRPVSNFGEPVQHGRQARLTQRYTSQYGFMPLLIKNKPNAIPQYMAPNTKFETAKSNTPKNQTLVAMSASQFGTLIAIPLSEISDKNVDQPSRVPETSFGKFKRSRMWEWMTIPHKNLHIPPFDADKTRLEVAVGNNANSNIHDTERASDSYNSEDNCDSDDSYDSYNSENDYDSDNFYQASASYRSNSINNPTHLKIPMHAEAIINMLYGDTEINAFDEMGNSLLIDEPSSFNSEDSFKNNSSSLASFGA
ncbi:hypothetical protein HOG98_05155 [bacterium]|jgi:hypothetical protein|nr:hypothetical protein [bacterium]